MKVAILMSTYNGEKYLNEQISSIIDQRFKNWNLYVRDDGSTDRTCKIVKDFCEKDKRIHLLPCDHQRLKPKNSFFSLLEKVEADYYFFSDQDDVWKDNKLSCMLRYLNLKEPMVVYCGLQCTDSNLSSISMKMNSMVGSLHGRNRFFANDIPGCTMAINNKTKELLFQGDYYNEDIIMHDWWLALIAQSFGKIIYVDKKLVYYRQHGNNTLGAGKNRSYIKKIISLRDIIVDQLEIVKETWNQTDVFYKSYNHLIDPNLKKFLINIVKAPRKNFLYRYKFFRNYKITSTSKSQFLLYRIIYICCLKRIIKKDDFDTLS